MVKERINIIFRYWIFWMAFFIACRTVFVLYNIPLISKLKLSELLLSYMYGLRLDLSTSGYIMFFALIVFILFFFLKGKVLNIVLKTYTFLFLVPFIIIAFVDIELYRNWGFRIDGTVFLYLKTPKDAMASTAGWLIGLIIFLIGLTIWGINKFYNLFIGLKLEKTKVPRWYIIPMYLFLAGAMIVPIRGGFGIAPINVGTVFFSEKQTANHTAINVHWNFGKSLLIKNENKDLRLIDTQIANQHFEKLMKSDKTVYNRVLKNENTNVIIIILESFNNNVIEVLGGLADVTPNINSLAKEGILFSNCYASGDRSDKGIVSILSGYPAQPTTSILRYTSKTEKLPHLSKMLNSRGYSSKFYYGGEINFANMNSYFLSGEYHDRVTLDDFSSHELNSKWGAHDHVVLNRFVDDLNKEKSPFFKVLFTLSSHEPFDVPHSSKFSKNNEESKFLNSVHYTDSCIGNFIKQSKQTNWWQNTLVVLIADHGSRWPGNIPNHVPEKFEIPMLWLGGVLSVKDTVVTSTVSQVDVPKMIGNQLGVNTEIFSFSKDVLNGDNEFALYVYNNGFGFITDRTKYVYDIAGKKVIKQENTVKETILDGKSYLQLLLEDYTMK